MIRNRLQGFSAALRPGLQTGFVSGLILVFLILIGIPVRIENLALFSLLLTVGIFGIRIGRKLRGEGLRAILSNALAAGLVASVIVLLLMALINRWQARGIDIKRYFDAVSGQTMTVLSGVPADELHRNPPIDPLTGAYVEGKPLRTDPFRLTFDPDTALHLKFGMTGESVFDINLVIGGLYGFALVVMLTSLLSASATWAWIAADVGRYRRRASGHLTGNPVARWALLLLPLVFFGLFWLTEGQGAVDPILHLRSGEREAQLLIGFLIILWALVAMRSAESNDWGLAYRARVAVVAAAVTLILLIGVGRIVGNNSTFIATDGEPNGSQTLSTAVLLAAGLVIVARSAAVMRTPGRFEGQIAQAISLAVLLIVPLYLDQYQTDVMTLVGINIMLGLGLNIVVGYAGLLDLGYVAFFALGAYTYAFLSSNQMVFDAQNQPTGLKFAGNDETVIRMAGWLTVTVFVAAAVIAGGLVWWRRSRAARAEDPRQRPALVDAPPRPSFGVTALLVGLAVIVSLVVVTLLDGSSLYNDFFSGASPFLVGIAAGVLVAGIAGILLGIPVLRLRGDYLAIVTLGFGEIIRLLFNNLRDFTGGPQGVLQIPRPLPENVSGPASYLTLLYLVLLGAALIAFFSARLKRSRTGRAWSAMKSDERIAQSMGVNLVQSKLLAFAIGAAFAGIGGVLFAARQRNIFPGDFRLDVSIEVLSLVIIGGMGSIPGVIMGAIVLIGLPEVLRELATYRILVFGALLVAMVIIRPRGLLPDAPAALGARARRLAGRGPLQPEQETEPQ